MRHLSDDVPSPVDFRCEKDAREWANRAIERRPIRAGVFVAISQALGATNSQKVLELGSGPGFLAERIAKDHPEIEYTALDSSRAMHSLAQERLGANATRVWWVEADFKVDGWSNGLGEFDAAVTVQAVHELRHKRHASTLYRDVLKLLRPGGVFLMCDHFVGDGGMTDRDLFMTPTEHEATLLKVGFSGARLLLQQDGLVLFRSINPTKE
jgi:cyclopropane fatty-acyl-phospholipid synthase-like methyltransferase